MSRRLVLAALALAAAAEVFGCNLVLGIPSRELDPHADCSGGTCTCTGGFADCDGDPETGCEVDLSSDAANCGACGHDCLGGACSSGACQNATVANLAMTQAFALSGGSAFLASCDETLGPIDVYAEDGGAPTGLVPSDGGTCGVALGVTGANVYWTDTYELYASPIGSFATPTSIAAAKVELDYMGVNSVNVFYTDAYGIDGIWRVPVGGGAQVQITTAEINAFLVDEAGVVWADTGGGIYAVPNDSAVATTIEGTAISDVITIDADRVFSSNSDTGDGIYVQPRTGGPRQVLVPDVVVRDMTRQGDSLFWAGADNGIWQLELSDPLPAPKRLTTFMTLDVGTQILADDRAVYWLEQPVLYRIAR